MLMVVTVGERRSDHILSAQLHGQDGHPHAVPPALRALTQRQQVHVVWSMGNDNSDIHCLHLLYILDYVLL